jgi:GWxTD domain-containing protein
MTRTFIIPWSILGMVNEEDDALRLLNYIADKEDVKAFKKTPDDEKQAFWVRYWTSSDPVTSTPWNERIALYERRIMYSNDKFSSFEEGWKTDMGMIHIIFGAPDEIERHPFDLDSKPYQIWTYYALGRQFVFVDRNGFGRYDLVYGDYSRR